jgi:uncharacterized membrane protein YgcG
MGTGWRGLVSALVAVGVVAGALTMAWIGELDGGDDAYVLGGVDQVLTIDRSGATRVTEDIGVTFVEERRGIIRQFDEQTPFPSRGAYDDIEVDRGEDDDPWTFAVEDGTTGPSVRIGDADVTLMPGRYHYRLRYDAPSWYFVPEDSPEQIEVRIDSPGYDWDTTIGPSSVEIELPGTVREAACVEGERGTTEPCRTPPVIDGDHVRFDVGPFGVGESATVSVVIDRDAISANVPTSDLPALGTEDGSAEPWPGGPYTATALLLAVLVLPLLVWEFFAARLLYRDRVTDPAIHDRPQPTAIPAPPMGFRPPELAGLLLRRGADELFLATLVDLDQRGLVTTSAEVIPATERREQDKETLTVGPPPPGAALTPADEAFLDELLPEGATTSFDGTYDETVAARVSAAQSTLHERAKDVFEHHGLLHDDAGLMGNTAFRIGMALAYLAFAAVSAVVVGASSVLDQPIPALIAGLVVVGWGLAHLPWAHHRVPLNSEGRDTVARARSFREFVRTVEGEQLEWAAGQPGIDHHHPAVSLLPYAIALGLADSWYERFGQLMRELAVATAGGAATAAGATWWASQSSFESVRTSQSGTSTSPSSSGGGGGGGGSGGGGGGGSSW